MMEWINIFGAVFIVVIMVPNIVFALKCKEGFINKWNNKGVEIVEQIGRFGCFGCMVINVPGIWFGWWSDQRNYEQVCLADGRIAVVCTCTYIDFI